MVNMRSEGNDQGNAGRSIVVPSLLRMQDDLTFLDFLLIITQRKKLVGMVTAICTGIALILAFGLPQEYTATVIILPPQGNSSMSSMLASQLAGMGSAVSGMAGTYAGNEKRQRHVCVDVEEPHGGGCGDSAVWTAVGVSQDLPGGDTQGTGEACEDRRIDKGRIDPAEFLGSQPEPRGGNCERICGPVSKPVAESRDHRGIAATGGL